MPTVAGDIHCLRSHRTNNKQTEATVRGPVVPDAPAGRNMRQSPFGTDVMKYESLTAYSWEDANGTTVKVSVPFEGVGALGANAVKVNFGERQFEVLVTRAWSSIRNSFRSSPRAPPKQS